MIFLSDKACSYEVFKENSTNILLRTQKELPLRLNDEHIKYTGGDTPT